MRCPGEGSCYNRRQRESCRDKGEKDAATGIFRTDGEHAGEEYPAFLKSYDIARYQALRLNPQKGDDVSFLNRGGLLAGACTVGRAWLLLHGKGYAWKTSVSRSRRILYPGASAMAPAAYLTRQMADGAGERILICARQSGKSTQIAAAMEGRGTLISNEIHPAWAKILSENIERMELPMRW